MNITNIVIHILTKSLNYKLFVRDIMISVRPWRIELQPEHWQCPDLPLIDDRIFFNFVKIMINIIYFSLSKTIIFFLENYSVL